MSERKGLKEMRDRAEWLVQQAAKEGLAPWVLAARLEQQAQQARKAILALKASQGPQE